MRHFSSEFLIVKRQFGSLTGVSVPVFRQMVKKLSPHWDKQIVKRKKVSGRPWGIGGLEEHLLVLLILYRCHLTQDFMGMLYDVDRAAICRSLRRIEAVAVKVLGVKRNLKVSAKEAQMLMIDGTEQRIERPKKHQEDWYSGKKKAHTIKTEVIVTDRGKIVSVSMPFKGKTHDYAMRKQGCRLPPKARIYVDSGYQGLQKDHLSTEIPYKKSKKNPLSSEDKEYNRALSAVRVHVEHALARIKRFRILSDRFRYPNTRYYTKFSTIAGIANLMNAC